MSSKIVFCGVGALGSTTAVLCRNLPVKFTFIDFNRVDSKNLITQAYIRQSIGKNKAVALKLQLMNFYGVKADAFTVKLVDDNVAVLLNSADLIVDCFDDTASRELLSTYARNNNKALIHGIISADGSCGLVRWEENFTVDKEDEKWQVTYKGGEHLPMIGLISAALARSIQDFINSGLKKDYQLSLDSAMCSF